GGAKFPERDEMLRHDGGHHDMWQQVADLPDAHRGNERASLQSLHRATPCPCKLISMTVEICLDARPIILYSLKYGKLPSCGRSCGPRAGASPRGVSPAGAGRTRREARRASRGGR